MVRGHDQVRARPQNGCGTRRSGYRRMAFRLVAVVAQAGHDLLRRSGAPAARSRTGPGSA
jgi:hypothetical protein